MSIPLAFTTQFLQLITERQFTEAERVFKELRNKVDKTEWNRGYLRALNGMLLAQKSNDDRYLFLLRVNSSNRNELREYRLEFSKYAKNELYADYDRGFFSAWAEYMRFLSKLRQAQSTE